MATIGVDVATARVVRAGEGRVIAVPFGRTSGLQASRWGIRPTRGVRDSCIPSIRAEAVDRTSCSLTLLLRTVRANCDTPARNISFSGHGSPPAGLPGPSPTPRRHCQRHPARPSAGRRPAGPRSIAPRSSRALLSAGGTASLRLPVPDSPQWVAAFVSRPGHSTTLEPSTCVHTKHDFRV